MNMNNYKLFQFVSITIVNYNYPISIRILFPNLKNLNSGLKLKYLIYIFIILIHLYI